MSEHSFLIFSANSPWTYGIAEALASKYHTHAIQFYDWLTYRHLQPSWSLRNPPPLLRRSIPVLPTGYAGRLEKLFRFYLQNMIRKWCYQLEQASGEHPWVIAPEPFNAPWVRKVPENKLIYYNFDDYSLYRPNLKDKILKQEDELIERANITLCASHFQALALRMRHPDKASRIYHYPHGFVDNYLNPDPKTFPEPMTVGFVGNLGDRLDWQLIYCIIEACPDICFVFVGGLDEQIMFEQGNWQASRQKVLTLSNVRHIGRVSSDLVASYYWSFKINWIPYLTEHPFNKAACSTKIMDGIASGNPVLSTDLPECRIYPGWINIFNSSEAAITLIRKHLNLSHNDHYDRSLQQLEFAKKNTWQVRAAALKDLLGSLENKKNNSKQN